MKEVTVGKNDAGQRLDRFLVKAYGWPVSLIYKYLRKKRIKLDGARADGRELLCEGSLLQLYINDELFENAKPAAPAAAVRGDIDVVFEDGALAVLNKPAGLLSHADPGQDSLVSRFIAHLIETGEFDPSAERSFTPALCNRLDRNTCGLVLAAKTASALRETDEFIRQRKIHKYYLCVTDALPFRESGELGGWLLKDEKANRSRIYESERAGAREIRTGYRVLEKKGGRALVEVELFTGRPHQIRAAFANAGFPLAGDVKYGGRRGVSGGQALCAYKLVFGFEQYGGALDGFAGETVTLNAADWPRL